MSYTKAIYHLMMIVAMLTLSVPVLAASDATSENLNLRKEFSISGNGSTERISSTELASSVKLAITATLMRLRDAPETEVEKQLSVHNSGLLKPESEFTYDGFVVESTDLFHYAKDDDAPLGRTLAGYLRFVDAFGRRAGAIFELRYDITKGGLDLKKGFVAPIMPLDATVIMVVVPTETLDAVDISTNDLTEFLQPVMKTAVPINDAVAISSKEQDYTIVLFFMDRLSPKSQVEVMVSKTRDGLDGYGEATAYRSFDNNWVVAAIPGRLALSDDKVFWIKALYRNQEKSEPSLIGLFSTAPGPVEPN